jgi:hypothetical protein
MRIASGNLLLNEGMGLGETIRHILDLVERTSGYPVLVTEDRSLKTLATVRMARGDAPAHTITYNPLPDTRPDYFIAYECGFVLRLFANPPAERWDLAPAAQGREIVRRLLSRPDGPPRKLNLDPPVVEQLRDQLFDGLYLVTWNCRHIANAQIRNNLSATCSLAGYQLPVICTPEELLV